MSQEMITLYGSIGSLLLAAVVFFLKRTMNRVDTHDEKIQHIEKTYVEKSEYTKTIDELKSVIEESKNSSDRNYQKLFESMAKLQQNCISKEDFYRSTADTNKKIDKMYDFMLEERSKNGK